MIIELKKKISCNFNGNLRKELSDPVKVKCVFILQRYLFRFWTVISHTNSWHALRICISFGFDRFKMVWTSSHNLVVVIICLCLGGKNKYLFYWNWAKIARTQAKKTHWPEGVSLERCVYLSGVCVWQIKKKRWKTKTFHLSEAINSTMKIKLND